jgi:hypothetical protein
MEKTIERFGFHTWATVNRFRSTDIEAAIRDGGLIPQALDTAGKLSLRVFGSRSAAVPRAVQAVQMDELLTVGVDPFSLTEAEYNLEVYTGINAMLRLLIGASVSAGGTNYANGAARLCIGDGGGTVPSAAVTDTTLAATSNRYNQACDSTYPQVPSGGNNSASAILTAQSTFPTGQGNFVWNEWAMDKGGASGSAAIAAGDMFNHKGVNLGTKTSAAAWALQVTFTQS